MSETIDSIDHGAFFLKYLTTLVGIKLGSTAASRKQMALWNIGSVVRSRLSAGKSRFPHISHQTDEWT